MPLPFELREQATFDRFVVGANSELLAHLRQRPSGFDCLWLVGERGVGKTHLLHALCHEQPASAYVPADRIRAAAIDASTTTLDAYGRFAAVAVDDVPSWLGDRQAELALMGLYNRLRERDARLVMAARRSPTDIDFALADLASRLRAAACYEVMPLNDSGKRQLLLAAASDRGLRLSDDVVSFLLVRVSREQRELMRVVERLDQYSLAAKRRVTIPFVKQALCL